MEEETTEEEETEGRQQEEETEGRQQTDRLPPSTEPSQVDRFGGHLIYGMV